MAIGLKLLLSDYERARAAGDVNRAKSIFKEMEKIGLPNHLKPSKVKKQQSSQPKQKGIMLDPGRF